jgi:iron uptake system component EfeO
VPTLVGTVLALSACGGSETAGGAGGGGTVETVDAGAPALTVISTDTECTPSVASVTAGTVVVRTTSKTTEATELYVERPDGSVVAERANVEPGDSEDMVVEMPPGDYVLRCKPGKTGQGITASVTAAGGTTAASDPRLVQAAKDYRAYVLAGAKDSLAKTEQLSAAITAGDAAKAKALYAPSREGWESLEPVAESFGDLDPKVDLREADLEPGQKWTGWHVIEKQLFTTGTTTGLEPVAADLLANLKVLVERVPDAQISAVSMANGAKELLDEVATGKITGEEEIFSHTDLDDFQANLDGARTAFELIEPVAAERDAALVDTLTTRFAAVQTELDRFAKGEGFVSYDTVGDADRKKLADVVDALAEPLSRLAASVAS